MVEVKVKRTAPANRVNELPEHLSVDSLAWDVRSFLKMIDPAKLSSGGWQWLDDAKADLDRIIGDRPDAL